MTFPVLSKLPKIKDLPSKSKPVMSFSCDKFSIDFSKNIQTGTYSKVYEGKFGKKKMPSAIKVIEKSLISTLSRKRSLEREITHLKETKKSKHIITLFGVYVDYNNYYLVFEKMDRDLHSITLSPMEEEKVKKIVYEIALGVKELHSKGIVHRDLKIENILVSEDLETIKICDLGFARKPGTRSHLFQTCGSHDTLSPEVIMGKGYRYEVDIWALGCIMYILLTNTAPFYSNNLDWQQILKNMKSMDVRERLKRYLSEAGLDLIGKLLTFDQDKRIDINEVLDHPWFRN